MPLLPPGILMHHDWEIMPRHPDHAREKSSVRVVATDISIKEIGIDIQRLSSPCHILQIHRERGAGESLIRQDQGEIIHIDTPRHVVGRSPTHRTRQMESHLTAHITFVGREAQGIQIDPRGRHIDHRPIDTAGR